MVKSLSVIPKVVGLPNKITMKFLNLCIPNGQRDNPASYNHSFGGVDGGGLRGWWWGKGQAGGGMGKGIVISI